MTSRTRATTKKRRRVGNKKAAKKKSARAVFLIIGLVFVGALSYALYRLFTPGEARPPFLPVFEIEAPETIETEIKQIDRSICDALVALNILASDVTFKTVQPKSDSKGPWTFSELEIYLPETIAHSNIKEAFLARLLEQIPKKALRFISGPQQDLILDLFINGHRTHRLVFIKPKEKKSIASPPARVPRVAIIIDDLGYDERVASTFLSLNGLISFSVLPHSPFQESIATAVYESGRDLLLHLPMEPMEHPQVDPGVGALLSSMTPDDFLDQLQKNLDAVPFAVGVNNHMGSKLTQDPAKMRLLFTILKKRDLFFVDSLTGPGSYCQQAARLLQVKFAQRQVFLDHVQDPAAIRFQIKRLVSIAKEHGQAIGIGHPYPATWEVLNEELPGIKDQVELVGVSELVE